MTLSSTIRLYDGMSGPAAKIGMAIARARAQCEGMKSSVQEGFNAQVLTGFERVVESITDQTDALVKRMDRLPDGMREFQDEARAAPGALNGLESKIMRIIGLAAGGFGIKKLFDTADARTNIKARLSLIVDDGDVDAVYNQIVASANRARAPIQQTADMASKLGLQAGRAFSNTDEIVRFSEAINKSFVIAGTEAQGIDSAMYNLTQALSTGVLRGQDFNAVMSNAPMILQAVADYLEVDIGQLRNMAAEGQITSDIIKNAMFAATDDINSKFASMPMTWKQLWTLASNAVLQAFQPLLDVLGAGAQWIHDNWSTIAPIFWGIVGAVGALVAIIGIWKAVTWLQVAAQWALNHAFMASGIGAIVIAIGLLIGWLVSLSQKVGGLKIVWLIVCDALKTAWDYVVIGVMTGVYWIMDFLANLKLAFTRMGNGIANFMGDFKAGVLMILQGLVNGAIDIINFFIKALNLIPGVNIRLIEHVTFGTTAQLENEAAKQARANDLAAAEAEVAAAKQARANNLAGMKADAAANHAARQAEINAAKAAAAAETSEMTDPAALAAAEATADNTGRMADSLEATEEELKYLRDIAEREVVNRFTTAEITINQTNENHISSDLDLDGVVGYLNEGMQEAIAIAVEGAEI